MYLYCSRLLWRIAGSTPCNFKMAPEHTPRLPSFALAFKNTPSTKESGLDNRKWLMCPGLWPLRPPPHRVYFQALGFSKSEDVFLIPRDASQDGSEIFQLFRFPPRELPDGLDGEKRVLMRMCAALSCVSSPLPSMPFLSALCVRVCGRVWTEKLNRFEIESGVFVFRCERQREGERVNEPVWSITRPSQSSTAWNSGWRTGRGAGGGPGW